jgi:hypothetical protein
MAGTREKGKIPHGEWTKILARYRGGETIAQIGRDYGCTPPAIRYIIKRGGGVLKGAIADERLTSRLSNSVEVGGARYLASSAAASLPVPMGRAGRAMGKDILGAELRTRVSSDVALFLVALDQAVIDGSAESVAQLQDATDRLMRSTARTRLELERLLSGQVTASGDERRRKKIAARPHRDA